jgi:hypothetical protein
MAWQPVLEGAAGDRAWESLQAIVDDLTPPGWDPAGDFSLAGGTAGLAILYGYLAQPEVGRIFNPPFGKRAEFPSAPRRPDGLEIRPTWRDKEAARLAGRCLQHATAAAADQATPASLYSGLTGVGWALAHLQGRLPALDGEDDLADIDEVLLQHLDQSPWTQDYDLISGLVGFGVYALERLPEPMAVACLERVVDRLAETAEHRPDGITWWTNPAWLPAEARKPFPGGYWNLGLAHGVPGVIALLGGVCAAGVAVARARSLLEEAVRWLLAQQLPGGFPFWVGPEGADRAARLAWCYGDPGVAIALLGAARCLNEPAWEREALAIARRAAERPADQAGVRDAGLCHGSAGLGHLFNRLYQATGEPGLGVAARFWLARTLEMRRPGRGIGGYEAWLGGDDGSQTWSTDSGLLTGAVGIALALLAATTPLEPAWDRMLLAAIPPVAC